MLGQSLISILLLIAVILVGYYLIYKPWAEKNLSLEKLEKKKVELQRKKEVLENITQEIDVTEDLTKIEKELSGLNKKLEKVSRKRN